MCAFSAVFHVAVVKTGSGTVFDQFSLAIAIAVTITVATVAAISTVVKLGGARGECFEIFEYSH